jgi:hypothetical protein
VLAINLLGLLDAAECAPRRIAGLLGAHSLPHILRGEHLDMGAQFFVELALETTVGEESVNA